MERKRVVIDCDGACEVWESIFRIAENGTTGTAYGDNANLGNPLLVG